MAHNSILETKIKGKELVNIQYIYIYIYNEAMPYLHIAIDVSKISEVSNWLKKATPGEGLFYLFINY